MYETRSQDGVQERGESILYFSVAALIIFLSFIFLIINHFTKYLYIVCIGFIVWGIALVIFMLDWRCELRMKAIHRLFPENGKWYPVKPRRHTKRRLSNRKYDVQRIGTTLRIRTVYLGPDSSEDTIQTIEFETFMSNYVLMKEKSAK
jgi:Ca2+/Na+ antiporter